MRFTREQLALLYPEFLRGVEVAISSGRAQSVDPPPAIESRWMYLGWVLKQSGRSTDFDTFCVHALGMLAEMEDHEPLPDDVA